MFEWSENMLAGLEGCTSNVRDIDRVITHLQPQAKFVVERDEVHRNLQEYKIASKLLKTVDVSNTDDFDSRGAGNSRFAYWHVENRAATQI